MYVIPDKTVATAITSALTGETVIEVNRLTTGNQNYVYAVKTDQSEYVIRLTSAENKHKFSAALYWQNKLLHLGVPLARFIAHDLDGKHSPFPALLMKRLLGDDIGKVYSSLTDDLKKKIASQMVNIHKALTKLPEGRNYGYASSYEANPPHKSWYDFLLKDLSVATDRIKKAGVFSEGVIAETSSLAEQIKANLNTVRPQPFMPDTTVKNVLIHKGELTGIVDVDDLCFGDPLFALSLTYAGSEIDGHDTVYADYWASFLKLDIKAKIRLEFYRLLHTIWFMGEHSLTSVNGQKLTFDVKRLNDMYRQSILRMKSLITSELETLI